MTEGGLIRIDGAEGPRAVVVINDEQSLRDATRPKAAAKLLDHLGRLDSYDGFDEIFDLLQRHVFDEAEPSGRGGASKAKTSTPDEANSQPEPGVALPFGPRGVSLADDPEARTPKPSA